MSSTLVSSAPPSLGDLPARVLAAPAAARCVAALAAGESVAFEGVWGSAAACLAAGLAHKAPAMLLVVCADGRRAQQMCDDLALFQNGADVAQFPAWETAPHEHKLHDTIYGERLRVLKTLAQAGAGSPLAQAGAGSPRVLVTCAQALLQPAPERAAVAAHSRALRLGQKASLDELAEWLVAERFHSTPAVQLPGEFSRRGGILDIFAPDWSAPVRVEFADDEIDSLRAFDVATQRGLRGLTEVEITVLPEPLTRQDHLASYLPPGAWILLIDLEEITREAEAYRARSENPDQLHTLAEAQRRWQGFPLALAAQLGEGFGGPGCRLPFESVERLAGDLEHVRRELERVGAGHQVYLAAQTEAEAQRLREIFASSDLLAQGRLSFPPGQLHESFRVVSEAALVLSGHQLFQRSAPVPPRARRVAGKSLDSFLDLREGDLVVHLAHGVGRYRGLRLLKKEGREEEHLELEFADGVKVYVPATRIDLVQKYVGGTKSAPRLAKIGGVGWQKQRKAAELAVMDLAVEMLDLQAARTALPGIAFSRDSDWQREFEASFPYPDTPDQALAWQAIQADMRRARPMDRLLCGDVGFGKTEIAMRAAFRAVDNGYQVAVMAPTTILAEQHYHTFSERMAEFPVGIGRLSRFCAPDEERDVLRRAASGALDIVIGTHRVASRDVRFRNLGLVVIDEEQRFGVEVKERLKALRASVDVLTLSATPIPRTLHMSLVGVRDISNLETPPDERRAIETHVGRCNDELIRHAVLRELNRGGQIFFVHNRVEDLHLVAQRLNHIVPDARVRMGHGQMPEDELERVMVDFVRHRFDVLLATTIIESGLDIPNANTIFVNEADRFGLAALHQLRGRVGRGAHQAYGYFLVNPGKKLTPNAARRLRAIEEFSRLGAGFAISMRDLEIRGAGNLLGSEQSGHIAAVGYELYCQLLENAVRQLRQMPPKLKIEVEVILPGEAYLPDVYVPDMRLKIDLYRRLARVESFPQLEEFRQELLDRFGKPPAPTERMLLVAEIKLLAATWQVATIFQEKQYLVLKYVSRPRIEQLARRLRGAMRIVDDESAYLTLSKAATTADHVLAAAKNVLQAS